MFGSGFLCNFFRNISGSGCFLSFGLYRVENLNDSFYKVSFFLGMD